MFFNLFSIEFVANHALLVALNLSRIMHFWCKFLGPQKAAGVNVLPFCNSVVVRGQCTTTAPLGAVSGQCPLTARAERGQCRDSSFCLPRLKSQEVSWS